MLDTKFFPTNTTTYRTSQRANMAWWAMYLGLIGASIGVSLITFRVGAIPQIFAWLFYILGIAVIIARPRYGVYMLVGLTLAGDTTLVPWYPFTKNFSSRESLLFLNDALIVSPLETYVALVAIAWFGRMIFTRKVRFYTGPLFWPATLFLIFVSYGLIYGIGRNGNLIIGLWEGRPIYYLLAMLILVSNFIEQRSHVYKLIWISMIALFVKSVFGLIHVAFVLNFDLSSVESIADHSMSIHFNSFFALAIAVWLFDDTFDKRLILPLMAPTVLIAFFANHRRAGFLTLGVVVVLLIVMLFKQNRKLFWWIAPTTIITATLYTAAFWNADGIFGMPARSVRSVIGVPSPRDLSSNLYRDIENLNIMFTIKAVPIQGLGFGQKFYIPYAMPDISIFPWWEYITHNSIMYIWMKLGVGGFLSLMFLIGTAAALGGRVIWNMPNGPLRVAAVAASCYVLAHFIYAYVDMSWDGISMVYIGSMLGLLNCLERIAAVPVPKPALRWPWLDRPPVAAKRVLSRWNM